MPEYIYPDDELDIDENEVFVGFIRKNCEMLIRCKDCKFWDSDHIGTGLMLCHISDWNTIVRNADDYCSNAERKEE